MIDQITKQQIIDIPYYEDNSRISNSAIGWFLNKGPTYLHKRLTGEIEEESTSAMARGTMIHMFLLQPEEFQHTYKVWNGNKPQSEKQEAFCHELANTIEIEPNRAILSAFKKVYSTANQTEERMLSKGLEIASTLKDYIDYLKHKDCELITQWQYNQLLEIKDNVNNHKLASKLLWPEQGETHHEFHINWEYNVSDDNNINCKSLLDSVNFDFENKHITLMDIKTTTNLYHFEDSINHYDYTRQLEFYRMAIYWYLYNEREIKNLDEWDISFYIIAIDTTGSNEIRVFKFESNANYMYESNTKIQHALEKIYWHQKENLWEHTREYYEGEGAEYLKL